MGLGVLVVDDHAVVRQGVRSVLEAPDSQFRVVAEAGSIAAAREALEQHDPEIVLLDVVLPDGDGIQFCREIGAERPDVTRVVLTSFVDDHALISAAIAGASAYVRKGVDEARLLAVLGEVVEHGSQLDRTAVAEALDRLRSETEGPDTEVLQQLSDQERRVFELIGQGLSNREVAAQLCLTEKTVKNYVSRVLSKLHMHRRTEVAALASRLAERRAQGRARHGHD